MDYHAEDTICNPGYRIFSRRFLFLTAILLIFLVPYALAGNYQLPGPTYSVK